MYCAWFLISSQHVSFLSIEVADLYNVTAFCPVTVTQVGKREEARVRRSNAADFITVTMKDQFVSR